MAAISFSLMPLISISPGRSPQVPAIRSARHPAAEAFTSTGSTGTPRSRASLTISRFGYIPGSWVSTPA
jgi:hypothetical protein